jgi:cyclophilin family peptidyl-prolyl cis-trans isomerase
MFDVVNSPNFAPFSLAGVADVVTRTGGLSTVVFDGRTSADRQGVFVRQIAADGTVSSDPIVLANSTVEGVQHDPSLATAADGSYTVVWNGRGRGDRDGIFAQRFSATGARVGDELLINQTVGGSQSAPAIATAPDGRSIVVWQGVGTGDFDGVFARLISATGEVTGNEIRVNTTTAAAQEAPSVGVDEDGNFVVVWASRGQDGDEWGVFGQRFSATGTAVGTEFRVNTTTAGSQFEPAVSMNAAGEFVVVWSSFAGETNGWDILGQRYDASGTVDGAAFLVPASATGNQREADIVLADAGELFITWSHADTTGNGWDARGRTFNNENTADGTDLNLHGSNAADGVGHQRATASALTIDGAALVTFESSIGAASAAVSAQRFTVDVAPAQNVAPVLQDVAAQEVSVGQTLDLIVTATDANSNDQLTFRLDTGVTPSTATITKTSNTTARVQWTPTAADRAQQFGFRVIVEDNGDPLLSDAVQFFVSVVNAPPVIDLNGTNGQGNNFETSYDTTGASALIVDTDLVISDADQTQLTSATATLIPVRDGASEVLSVVTTGTSITASYNSSTGVLSLSGTDTLANYQQVLRTLRYDNQAADPNLTERRVEVTVNDGTNSSAVATTTITMIGVGSPTAVNDQFTFTQGATTHNLNVLTNDNPGPGQAVTLTISSVTTPTKGGTVVIDNDAGRLLYTPTATATGTETFNYTIVRNNGSSSTATVTITLDDTNDAPTLAALPNVTVLAGSPLMIALDGEDADGDTITFGATSSNATLVSPTVLTGNRSVRMTVQNFGDMVFELFESQAPRATGRMIELAQDDFYEDIIFHRVINNFVIQGGDPTGTGAGGSDLGDFDDQFHVDLQHNSTGLLSMAKSLDDTNDSQFFITEGPSRHLDSNHTVFGKLVEGESVRDAISNVPVNASDRPLTNVVIDSVEVFVDNENGVLMLKAPQGASGTATITVTATDPTGALATRQFTVTVAPDTSNSPPWLADIPTITTSVNTPTTFQLTAVDVEGDPAFFLDEDLINTINADSSVINKLPLPVQAPANLDYSVDPTTGLLTIMPTNGLTGTHQIVVATTASLTGISGLSAIDYQVVNVTIS